MQCEKCNGPIELDTRFCGRCGTALPGARSAIATGAHAAVPFEPADLDELTELNAAKQRLTDEIETMIAATNGRKARPSEETRYEELRTEWKRVSEQITDKMEVFSSRSDRDRRARLSLGLEHASDAPSPDIDDRRDTDRRDPFPNRL